MPKAVPLKKVANAFLIGLKLSYKNKLQERKREMLFEILDDMAVALTSYAVENDNPRIDNYAWLLGELTELIDIPITERQIKKRKKK